MPSAEIDNQCFWQAVFRCFGTRESLPDLHGFKNVTDSGILHEWCLREYGRPPASQEKEQIRNDFLDLLKSADHRHYEPFPGVTDWLETVKTSEQACAGIATGGWEPSARLKLKLSGLDRFDLPLASSDDAVARADIMKIAANNTAETDLVASKEFTYVGDGVWDFQASRSLNWEFIGIAKGQRAMRLREAGVTCIRADFRKA